MGPGGKSHIKENQWLLKEVSERQVSLHRVERRLSSTEQCLSPLIRQGAEGGGVRGRGQGRGQASSKAHPRITLASKGTSSRCSALPSAKITTRPN